MFAAAALIALLAHTARSDSAALVPGSKAPVPQISNYICGERPSFVEPGKTYVVAFWVSWSPSCKSTLGQLNSVQEKFASSGVVVVGVSSESPEIVTAFLAREEIRKLTRFTLATDPDTSALAEFTGASEANGTPTAVIVKEGVVQWIGHPNFMENSLSQIVQGHWDLAAAQRNFESARAAHTRSTELKRAISTAFEAKNWPTVLQLMDQLIDTAAAGDQAVLRMNKAQVLLKAGKSDQAYALIQGVVKLEPSLRPLAASTILRTPDVQDRRVKLAIDMLESAQLGADVSVPLALADVGYGYSLLGDYSKAIDFTKRAIAAAASDPGPSAQRYAEELAIFLRELEAKHQAVVPPAT